MKLLELYEAFLTDAGGSVDEQGFVSMTRESKEPWLIKGKRLVLPTHEQLRNFNGEKSVVFHPLYENSAKPESDVLADYRRQIAERLGLSFFTLAYDLLRIATSDKEHKTLNPQQSKYLTSIHEAKPAMIETFLKLLEACELGQNQRCFVSIYLAKNAELEGKKHKRVAVVNFPLYEALVEDGLERDRKMTERAIFRKNHPEDKDSIPLPENKTYDVTLSVKERDVFLNLLEYLVPGLDQMHAVTHDMGEASYSRASDSLVAPSMHALMRAVEAIVDPLNAVCELFRDKLGEASYEAIRIKADWIEPFHDPAVYQHEIKLIPPTIGNDGRPLEQVVNAPTRTLPNTPQQERTLQAQEAQGQPDVETADLPEEKILPPGFRIPGRAAPLQEAQPQTERYPRAQGHPQTQAPPPAREYQPPPPHQPARQWQPPPQQYGYSQQQPYPQNTPPQYQGPAVTNANGKVDFAAARAANPALGAAVYQARGPMPNQGSGRPQGGYQPTWGDQPQNNQNGYQPIYRNDRGRGY